MNSFEPSRDFVSRTMEKIAVLNAARDRRSARLWRALESPALMVPGFSLAALLGGAAFVRAWFVLVAPVACH